MEIKWLALPENHDYPAAESYLNLLYADATVSGIVQRLRDAPVVKFKAKDIFRAAMLPLLDINNSHVQQNTKKIKTGNQLSPLLLVRGGGQLIIADGYHRLCSVYNFNEDTLVPCKIV